MTRSWRQAALQAQARHAERLVLVVEGGVHDVERRLGDAPGHAALPAVLDLPGDRRRAALVEQRVRVRRAAAAAASGTRTWCRPRRAGDGRPATRVSGRPSWNQCLLRHVAAGHGQEAGQARFGGQQVVMGAVEPALRQVVADGEQVAVRRCRGSVKSIASAKASARSARSPQRRPAGRRRSNRPTRLGAVGRSRSALRRRSSASASTVSSA